MLLLPVKNQLKLLRRNQFVDFCAQIAKHEIFFGGHFAVIDILGPLLERYFDAEFFVDGENNVEKVEAVDAEIVNGVAFGSDCITVDFTGVCDDIGYFFKRCCHWIVLFQFPTRHAVLLREINFVCAVSKRFDAQGKGCSYNSIVLYTTQRGDWQWRLARLLSDDILKGLNCG